MLEERHREAQRIRLEEIRLKYLIKERLHPRYSNWRSLFESQMGTVGFVQTFVKGEGDTDLATIDSSDEGSYAAPVGMSSAFVGTGITANGSGIGTTGGFDVGGPYLGFELGTPYPPSPPARWAAMAAIDASEYDTIVLRAIRGTGSNGGEAPSSTNQGLQLWYQLPGGDMVSIDTNPDGETDPNVDKYVVPAGSEDLGLTDWSITIPAYARKADVRFVLYQSDHNGEGSDNYGITKVFYRRQNPISLFVSLDSPEATSFVSVGQGPERTSPKKRRKKTEGQLRATQKYTDKKFGKDFPASKTTLEPDTPDAGDVYPQRNIDQAQRATGDKIGSGTKGTVKPFAKKSFPDFTWDELMARDRAGIDPYGTAWGGKEPTDAQEPTDAEGEAPTDAKDAKGSPEQKIAGELEADPKSDASQEGIKNILGNQLNKPEMANFWQELGKAGETFARHLTNTLPSTVDNNYLGKKYVNSAFNKASFNVDGTLNMDDNIMGTTQPPTYDSGSKEVVVPFNYDFTSNAQEFEKNKGQMNMLQKTLGRTVYAGLGKYSMDASPKFGSDPLSKAASMGLGAVLSKALTGAEAFGGGKHVPGEVRMSINDLKRTNAPLYAQLMARGIIPDPVKERQKSLGGTSFVSSPSSTSNPRKKKVTEATSTKKRLKKPSEIFNPRGDIKPVYPDTPPPKMVNGWHPEYGKTGKRFNRLDPISARSMPKTGDPEIDAKVRKAARKPK